MRRRKRGKDIQTVGTLYNYNLSMIAMRFSRRRLRFKNSNAHLHGKVDIYQHVLSSIAFCKLQKGIHVIAFVVL